MRELVVLASLCLACTRPNPAFDEATTIADDGSGTGDQTTTSEAGTEAGTETGSETDTSSSTGTPEPDLPVDPTCPVQPSPGLHLQLGGPLNFGGVCAEGIATSMRVAETAGGSALLDTCNEGCTECTDNSMTLSTFPLAIGDYLSVGSCLRVEAKLLLATEPEACSWGAITLWDPLLGVPHLVATAHSTPPTTTGAMLIANKIPAPIEGFACNCEAVGQANDCCYEGSPPAFFYYPFPGQDVYANEYIQLDLPNQAGLVHYFKVFQAELVRTCENKELQLSWALVGEP